MFLWVFSQIVFSNLKDPVLKKYYCKELPHLNFYLNGSNVVQSLIYYALFWGYPCECEHDSLNIFCLKYIRIKTKLELPLLSPKKVSVSHDQIVGSFFLRFLLSNKVFVISKTAKSQKKWQNSWSLIPIRNGLVHPSDNPT